MRGIDDEREIERDHERGSMIAKDSLVAKEEPSSASMKTETDMNNR